jgi:hypothetical protein
VAVAVVAAAAAAVAVAVVAAAAAAGKARKIAFPFRLRPLVPAAGSWGAGVAPRLSRAEVFAP